MLNEDKVDADALEIDMNGLDDAALQTPADSTPVLEGGEWGLRLTGVTTGNMSSAVSHEFVRFQVGSYSLWWAPGTEESMSMGMVTPDLPNPQCFARLLKGTWGDPLETETVESDLPQSESVEDAS